jgi:phosphoenolpyruvate phosphomutase
MSKQQPSLPESLWKREENIGVGIYDGLSCRLAAKSNFDFVWVGGFSCSLSQAIPDAGILSTEQLLSVVSAANRAASMPIVVDVDSGHGEGIGIYYLSRALAAAEVTAICIEDNPLAKRSSLYEGHCTKLASIEEHVDRLQASLAGINSCGSSTKVIARTESLVCGLGVTEALKRMDAYACAGASAIFLQSLDSSGEDIMEVCRAWKRRTPLFIAPTMYPSITRATLFEAGVSHIIYANHAIRAAYSSISNVFDELSHCGQIEETHLATVKEISEDLGEGLIWEFEQAILRQRSTVDLGNNVGS